MKAVGYLALPGVMLSLSACYAPGKEGAIEKLLLAENFNHDCCRTPGLFRAKRDVSARGTR